jgi:hypothetical protein
MLPAAVKSPLATHLEAVKRQHELDLQHGAGWVELPWALPASTRTPAANGLGNGSSRPPESTSIGRPASTAITTSMSPSFSGRSETRSGMPASPSAPAPTPSATPSPPTCWKTATTSAPCKSSSGTGT